MKEGWETQKLAEACQIRPSKDEARQRLAGVDLVSFVPMEDLGIDQKYLIPTQSKPLTDVVGNYTYFTNEDVLLAKITPCFENGKLGIAANLTNGVGFGSSEYIVFRPSKSLNNEWLYYFLSREAFRVEGAERMSGAVGHKRVSKDFIETYPIPLPSLPEQGRIVGILDKAFAEIATARANAEKNIKNTYALFEGLKQSLFPDDSNIDPDAQPLDKLCEAIVDCEHKTAPLQEHGIPSIRTSNIGKGRLLLDGVNRVSEETYKAWTRRLEPQAGDLILAREAPAGNVAVIPEGMKVCLGQRTVLIRPLKSILQSDYLAHLLLRKNSQKRFLAYSRGATVQHVNMKDIRSFKIGNIPCIEEQERFVYRLKEFMEYEDKFLACYRRKIAALDELKQSLLQKAFSGEL